MDQWKTQHLHTLSEKQDPQSMFDYAVRLLEDLDFVNVGLALYMYNAGHSPRVILYNNYSSCLNTYFRDLAFVDLDPITQQCHFRTSAVIWREELFECAPYFREVTWNHGLRYGWTQPVHDVRHNETQLSVSRPRRSVDTDELLLKGAQVLWLCNTLHALLSEHYQADLTLTLKLSKRELEVIKWSAIGKTASDIAEILSLSISTVNFHIRSVIAKTNAANKVGAVAIAVSQGLI
ncbi:MULTISPECIES: autoinducer binding domain-containing protein [unclassified Pseudomonas]|uniref:autoinducer binding domain-containing protein n=1 Tax=unclassified Pseudomonas TaxID=196821 RepID=UPI0035BF9AEB